MLSIHRFVHDLAAERYLLSVLLDFEEIGQSTHEYEQRYGQRALVFRAGECLIVSSVALDKNSGVACYLRLHPEGVAAVTFEVEDLHCAFDAITSSGGIITKAIYWFGNIGTFAIAAPIDDVEFYFSCAPKNELALGGYIWYQTPKGGKNKFNFQVIDHVTSNFKTIAPAVLWFKKTMGFEECWRVDFHTNKNNGTGLYSIVVKEKISGCTFPLNEPIPPNIEYSQVSLFCNDNRGSGIQHLALLTNDIMTCVTELQARGVRFYPAPENYYSELVTRLQKLGISEMTPDLETLRRLNIHLDVITPDQFLLQIFLADGALASGQPEKGAFFFEIIQRRNGKGFGQGNFRSLFESIEQVQI